jgi:predicted DNA-binding transcriptional regulator YafY
MKSTFNAPIKFDRQHNGYFYTEEGFSIREFPLTHEEIQALDYSTALLQQLKGTKMFYHFESAINKVIEGYRLSGILGKSETQILQVEEPLRTDSSRWLERLLTAIVEKIPLRISYQGFGREEKEHDMSPYLIKEYRNRWYVIGHSSRAKNILVMALDRINRIEPTRIKYVNDSGFSPADFFRYSLGITQVHGTKPVQVVLSFSAIQAPYILSQPLHQSQTVIKQTTDALHISLEVYLTPELRMTILSYGPEAEVLKPASLRKDISKLVADMKKMYA